MNNKYIKKISFDEAIKAFEVSLVKTFINKYTPQITKESVDSILELSDEIYENHIKNPGKNTLIVGNVQSGKTATYLGLISKFLDQDTNLAVVLPAVDKILFNQTYERINEVFPSLIKLVRVVEDDIQNERTVRDIVEALKGEGKVVIMGLKNKKQIDKITELILKVKRNITQPIMIDDEGDQASFDNIKETDTTATNKAIINLINAPTKRFSFFSITATPMAQIFVDKDAAIKPDFAFVTHPGKGYTGLNYYHKPSDREKDYSLRIIPAEDVVKLKDKKIRPKSLDDAILYYLAAAAYLHAKDGKIQDTSFLIHTHRRNSDHEKIRGWALGALDKIKKDWRTNKQRTIEKLEELIADSIMDVPENELESFIKLIMKHAEKTGVVIGNQENPKFKEVMNGKTQTLNTIYVGSQMLQRGVTLKNLITTYFSYRTKGTANCDTVLQRARWFGYREDYKELTRIYMDKVSESDFSALAEMNDDLFERLEELRSQNLNFVDSFEQSILLPYVNMKATRETVAKNGRNKQWRSYSDASIKNSPIAEELYNRLSKNSKLETMLKSQPFKGIKFDSYSDLKEWMEQELESIYKEVGITGSIRKDLEDFIQIEKLKFAVVLMNSNREDGVRERRIYENNNKRRFSITQGANKNYRGDRYWFEYPEYKDTFLIQIHKITPKNEENDKNIYFKLLLVSPKRVIGQLIHKKQTRTQ